MFNIETINKEQYSLMINKLKEVNEQWLSLRNSREYKYGMVLCELLADLKRLDLSAFFRAIHRWSRGKKVKSVTSNVGKIYTVKKDDNSDYFSDERIAVYTCITGGYDSAPTIYVFPDNVDYFIFTDSETYDSNLGWKNREIPNHIKEYSNVVINRYLKMHPHILFPDYKYSVYVDGNVSIYTDVTEFINKISDHGCGIAIHTHDVRDCVYDEIAATYAGRRENPERLKMHEKYLVNEKMPAHYGLLQCNVIARTHNNDKCKLIMEEWWEEYMKYSKRDQISLPHVLFKNGVSINEVGTLGNNVYKNPAIRVIRHL